MNRARIAPPAPLGKGFALACKLPRQSSRNLEVEPRRAAQASSVFRSTGAATAPASRKEKTMIDHIGLHVQNLAASVDFYAEALAPLGYVVWKRFAWRPAE
jgi:catechol-2,3-dioxygenase